MPAFKVAAIDTLGADDTFHAAFALAIAEGRALDEALRFASAAAALKCTTFGGGAGSPRRAEVNEFLKANDLLLRRTGRAARGAGAGEILR
jgi:sugar/nucleoside kinase (ribokinase family)